MASLSTHIYLSGQLQRVVSLFFSAFFLLFGQFARGQEIFYDDSLPDSTMVGVDTMPALAPFIADSLVQPYYSYLWIFSDGNFINGTRDSVVKHVFDVRPEGGEGFAKLLATGLYSDDIGDPPPRAVPGNTTEVKGRTASPLPKRAVDSLNFVYLQKNHPNIVPGDTTAWILSYRNSFDNFGGFDNPLSGYLIFFYNSPIRLEELDAKGSKKSYEVVRGGEPQRNRSAYYQKLSPLAKSGREIFGSYSLPEGLAVEDYYSNYAVFRYDTLAFGEERHLIFEIANDTALLDKVPEKTRGNIDFLAVMTTINDGVDFAIDDPEKLEIISKAGLFQFLENSPNLTDILLGNTILDVRETSATLSRAYDPNALTAWACACPPESEGEDQLVCRIDFMNEGGAPTSDIYLTFFIPPGLNPNSIPEQPLDIRPTPPDEKLLAERVNVIERNDERIVWHLEGFRLETTKDLGVGHPGATGHLTFTALTRPGTTAADLPPLRAAIVFDEASPVYTLPVEPVLLSYENQSEAGETLQCEACVMPAQAAAGNGFPWWLILLLALLLILILWLFLRNR